MLLWPAIKNRSYADSEDCCFDVGESPFGDDVGKDNEVMTLVGGECDDVGVDIEE